MSKAGDPPERIAAKLNVGVEEVESIIKEFDAVRIGLLSGEAIDMAIAAEVQVALNGSGDRIQEAMRARRFTGAYDLEGAPITEPDHSLALEAIKTTKELAEVSKPKGGGVNVAVGIQTGGNGNGSGQIKTFEQRVREKRGVLPDSDVKFLSDGKNLEGVIDGDVVDDDDELEDEDIDDMADGTSEAEIEEMAD
jgi:hypothetical protein